MKTIQQQTTLTYECLHKELRAFVLRKFLLTEEDLPEGESFNEITEISLSKSMKVSPELVKEFDTAQSCDGATSAMAKKVLLFRAIEKGLNIEIPAMESARLKSLDDLIILVWSTIKTTPLWENRITK